MWVDALETGSGADRADPAVGGACVEPSPVAAQQDRSLGSFADGQVDGASGSWDEGDAGGLAALADDLKGSVAAFEAEVFDVDATCLADAESVEPEQHGQRGVHR